MSRNRCTMSCPYAILLLYQFWNLKHNFCLFISIIFNMFFNILKSLSGCFVLFLFTLIYFTVKILSCTLYSSSKGIFNLINVYENLLWIIKCPCRPDNEKYLNMSWFQLFKRIAAALPGMDTGNEGKNSEDLIEVKLKDKTEPSAAEGGCYC